MVEKLMCMKQNKIVIKPVDTESKVMGIYLPKYFSKSVIESTVIRSSMGDLPDSLKVGDVVYTKPDCGSIANIDGYEVRIVEEYEIIAIK